MFFFCLRCCRCRRPPASLSPAAPRPALPSAHLPPPPSPLFTHRQPTNQQTNNKQTNNTIKNNPKRGKRAVAKGGHRYRQGQGGPADAPPGPAPRFCRAARPLPGVVTGGRGPALWAKPFLPFPFGGRGDPRTGRKSPGNEAESASLCGQDPRVLCFKRGGSPGVVPSPSRRPPRSLLPWLSQARCGGGSRGVLGAAAAILVPPPFVSPWPRGS